MADNNGNWACPTAGPIPTSTANMSSTVGDYDICICLVPLYIAEMPFDPSTGHWGGDCSNYDSGYTIAQTTTEQSRITINAPHVELNRIIRVTR